MKVAVIIFIFIFNIYASKSCEKSVTTSSGTHVPKNRICSGDLIFEENFDILDLRIWQHEVSLGGGGNNEFQWYTNNRSNSFVQNGILHIKPTFLADEYGDKFLSSGNLDIFGETPYDGCNNPKWNGCNRTGSTTIILNPVKSAKLRSLESFAFKYGKVEVYAKIPAGDWLWPAIWMMPKYYMYSNWPASGEIDIMESRGNKQLYYWTGTNIGTQQVTSTLHFGPNWHYDPYKYAHFEKNNKSGYDTDFHKYQMEWTPTYIKFLINDEETGTVNPPAGGFWELGRLNETGTECPWKGSSSIMAPFDDEFYIILNLAVGGGTFPDFVAVNIPGDKPWTNGAPTAPTDFWKGRNEWIPTWNMDNDDYHFKIDYVKVWAL